MKLPNLRNAPGSDKSLEERLFGAADVESGAAGVGGVDGGVDDGGGEFFDIGERADVLPALFDEAGALALEKLWSDGAFDQVAADDDEADAKFGEVGHHTADRVFAGFLAFGYGFIAFVDRLGFGKMSEVAGDEDDAATVRHEG
jgi:hypothetical protein